MTAKQGNSGLPDANIVDAGAQKINQNKVDVIADAGIKQEPTQMAQPRPWPESAFTMDVSDEVAEPLRIRSEVTKKVVQKKQSDLMGCFTKDQMELARRHISPKAKIFIEEDGSVQRVEVLIPEPVVETYNACLVSVFKSMKFPPNKGGAQITWINSINWGGE